MYHSLPRPPCRYEHEHTCDVHIYVYSCMEARDTFSVVLFFETGALVGIWWLSIMLSYLAPKPHGSACLCLLSAGILSTYNHTQLLIQVLGIKIMSSRLRASVLQTEIFYFLDLFYVYEYFAFIFVCVPYAWLVPMEVRWRLWIPWNLSYRYRHGDSGNRTWARAIMLSTSLQHLEL